MTGDPFEIVVTAPRAIREALPKAIAFAVIDFATGRLRENPRRVGAPLRGDLEGIWSARRGMYRVLYRINDETREVVLLRVGHRRHIFRTA